MADDSRRQRGRRASSAAPTAPRELDFQLATDAQGLASLVAGESPLKLMLTGRIRIRGSRRQAGPARARRRGRRHDRRCAARAAATLDADAVLRALPYMVDPAWTRGHAFVIGYHVDPGGSWYVHVNDGAPLTVTTEPPGRVDADVRLPAETFRRLCAGELSPNVGDARPARHGRGDLHAITLLGRWIDRAQGRDDAELEREERQRLVQANRVGTWGRIPRRRSARAR